MHNKISKPINWLNIIFNKEFQNYLDYQLLLEISMMSKLVRGKSKLGLFKSLLLTDIRISKNFEDTVFAEYLDFKSHSGVDVNIPLEDKLLSIQNGLNEISYTLNDIKLFTTSFNLSFLNRSGYYLFPIINIFDNLAVLKVRSCIIPYYGFIKLGDSLPNLNHIELDSVSLAKLPSDVISPSGFVFPLNLKRLELGAVNWAVTNLLSDPYGFLFNNEKINDINNFTLPKLSIPSLKNLAFFGAKEQESEIKPFLEINQNLESLGINYFDFDLVNSLKCLNSLEVSCIPNFNSNSEKHTLDTIKKLRVNNIFPDDYENVKELSLLFSSLEYLHLLIDEYVNFKEAADDFIIPILSNLPKLKTLKLEINTDEEEYYEYNSEGEDIIIEKLPQIESLILETSSLIILNINFENFNNLKKVEFKTNENEINTLEFKKKFNNYNNWKFKFNEFSIKGYRKFE